MIKARQHGIKGGQGSRNRQASFSTAKRQQPPIISILWPNPPGVKTKTAPKILRFLYRSRKYRCVMLCSKEAWCTPTTAITDPETQPERQWVYLKGRRIFEGLCFEPKKTCGVELLNVPPAAYILLNLSRIFSLGNRWSWQVEAFTVQYSKGQEKDKVWDSKHFTWHCLALKGMRCDVNLQNISYYS